MDELLANKQEIQAAMEEKDTVDDVVKAGKVIIVESKDGISLEVWEKLFIVAKSKIDDHNIGIQYNITDQLEARELK